LWLRARELLIRGDWEADAFESGNTVTQRSLHRDIWRFLEPNRAFTRVSGGGFDFVSVLVSGTISHYINDDDQQPGSNADDGFAVAAEEDLEEVDAPSRTRLYGKIKALFERLDGELPLHECKPTFFARARDEIDPNLSEYILLQVWGNAEVTPERRKPGVRKQID
jgi:hypothetical protein